MLVPVCERLHTCILVIITFLLFFLLISILIFRYFVPHTACLTRAAPDSDVVLVVAAMACSTHKYTFSSTTKTSSLSECPAWGRRNYSIAYISKTAYRMHLGPSPFDSAPRTLRDMKFSFWVNFPFNPSTCDYR